MLLLLFSNGGEGVSLLLLQPAKVMSRLTDGNPPPDWLKVFRTIFRTSASTHSFALVSFTFLLTFFQMKNSRSEELNLGTTLQPSSGKYCHV